MFLHPDHGFYSWEPAAWLRVSGGDALTFLQGQFTNDLRNLVAEGSVYGLWLNQKGKVLADSFVLPVEEKMQAYWVGSYFSPAPVIRERLEAYVIADDVLVEDHTAAWRGVTILGGAESAALQATVAGSLVFAGRRDRRAHTEWLFPASEWPKVQERLRGHKEVSAADMTLRRIHAGIPAVPADIGPGELPNEGGLDETAISYTKGCYLGQEVMARLKAMGQVRRRLLRVGGTVPPPAEPAVLYQGGKKVGELRSSAATERGFTGLALLSLVNLQPAAGLSLSPDGPQVVAVVEPS